MYCVSEIGKDRDREVQKKARRLNQWTVRDIGRERQRRQKRAKRKVERETVIESE